MAVRASWLTAALVPLALAACATAAQDSAPAAAAPPLPVSTAFTLTTGTPRTPEQRSMSFDRADLAIKVMPETRTIEGVATLDFTATAMLDRLVLELDTLFVISAVSLNGRPVNSPSDANIDGRLTIPLHEAMASGDRVSVRIAYAGRPHVAENAPWSGGFVWATSPDGRPWVATAVQGEGCDLFWPCIDHPQGGPARVDMHITVPSALSAPANGRFLGKQDHGDGWTTWNWTARDVDPYGVSLNVGPFVELSAPYESRFGNRIPMHYWHLASDDPIKVRDLFAEFSRQLEFYERTIGPFPFGDEKMGVVETPHLGMEHQTINAYGNGYRLDGKGYDWLLHHELAHEWFGNQMTNAGWDDMWLHEGFGSYMQPLYARSLNGDRAMEAELSVMRLTVANRFPLVSGRPLASHQVYDGEVGPGLDIYYKGALIAHTLRLLIGDEAFYDSLRRLIYGLPDPRPGNFEPRYATTPDLAAIVTRAAGRDMAWFFDAYVYQAALPDLRIAREGDRMTLRWVTGNGGAFPMPVEVEVDGAVQTLAMADGTGSLRVPEGAHVLIDPRNRVLRRLEHVEAFQVWQAEEAERVVAAAAVPAD